MPGERNIIIGVNGSYARGEVTSGSDVDIVVLGLGPAKQYQGDKDHVIEVIKSLGLKPTSPDGVFKNALSLSSLSKNIEGMDNTNESITRLMLFLLEGEWILNRRQFEQARRDMLALYVKDRVMTDKVCRYLLSTSPAIGAPYVDYEDKQATGKPPGLRRIKLRFLRCLMYFAGYRLLPKLLA